MNQLDITSPYIEKYYDSIMTVHNQFQRSYFDSFFFNLLPRMHVEDSHIVKLLAIKQDTPDTKRQLHNVLQDGIELLLRTK